MEAARCEDRTHYLRMSLMPASLYTVYKYGALTDCATWADMFHISTSLADFNGPWTVVTGQQSEMRMQFE